VTTIAETGRENHPQEQRANHPQEQIETPLACLPGVV